MKYFVESYGCTMNYGEGNELSKRMGQLGHVPSESPEDADIIILNTCTVVDTTEKKMLRRMTDLKKDGKEVVVTGCMAKAQPSRVASFAPGSLIIPPDGYGMFAETVSEKYGSTDLPVPLGYDVSEVLPIAQGCLGNCSYCITRTARGRLRSYPVDELSNKARNMINSGTKEILITAQDTGCYGMDIGTDLPSLLRNILKTDGEYRIRIGMMNPNHLSVIVDDLMDVMEDERIYRFLHIPVQSGSDSVLKRMNRPYSIDRFKDAVDKIRARHPDVSISTDLITGFPGETEEDHRMSMELTEWLRADMMNITRFSPRPGTEASDLEDQVHGRTSKERSRELTSLKSEIIMERNRDLVGNTVNAMITEKGKKGTVMARTNSYRLVVIPEDIAIGTTVTIEITDAAQNYVLGRLLNK